MSNAHNDSNTAEGNDMLNSYPIAYHNNFETTIECREYCDRETDRRHYIVSETRNRGHERRVHGPTVRKQQFDAADYMDFSQAEPARALALEWINARRQGFEPHSGIVAGH